MLIIRKMQCMQSIKANSKLIGIEVLKYLSYLEVAVAPGLGRMGNHGQHGVVELLVLVVEKDQLRPHVCSVRSSEHFWNVYTRPKLLEHLAHLALLVLGVEDG